MLIIFLRRHYNFASYYNEFCLFHIILVVKQSFEHSRSEALFSGVSGCYKFAA